MKTHIRDHIYGLAGSLNDLALEACRNMAPDDVHWLVTEQRKLWALERTLERRGKLPPQ